ncbi:MAG: M23 family metallopeptidase [Bacteroidales bacterium]|nr:M23 family metallopeptidase [Bacteroidales bacterium]
MKTQYKYNPDNVHFDKMNNGFKKLFWRVVTIAFAALFIAIVLNILFVLLFDSPGERMMRSENEELKRQYQVLQERKKTVDTVFGEIQRADENIFRLIFETEPAVSNIPEFTTIPYSKLKEYSDREIVMKTAEKLDSMLVKVKNERLDYDILRIKSEDKTVILPYIPAIQPIENRDLTRTASGYGYRLHPIYKIHKFHKGIDFTAPVGTPVFATGNGIVEMTTRSRRGSGNQIIIDHGYGFKSVYSHLNEINTRQRRTVERGEVIGTVGNTGLSSGPHLHYEVLFKGKSVNPVNFFFLELSPREYDKMIILSKNSGQSFD